MCKSDLKSIFAFLEFKVPYIHYEVIYHFCEKMGFYGLELLNVIYKVLKKGTARGKGALEATFSS